MSLPPEPLLKTFGARQLTPNGGAHPLMTTMSVDCARPFDRNTSGNSRSHRSFPTPPVNLCAPDAADVLLDGTLGRSLVRSTVSPARPWMLGPASPPVDLVAISTLKHGP